MKILVRTLKIFISLLMLLHSGEVSAFPVDADKDSPKPAGLVALYRFNVTSGNVIRNIADGDDTNDEALDLILDHPVVSSGTANAVISTANDFSRGVTLLSATVMRTRAEASSIYSQCRASNEISIEAWIKPVVDVNILFPRPVRIVTMSSRSNNGNFFLGHTYIDANRYIANVKRSNDGDLNGYDGGLAAMTTGDGVLKLDTLQQVIFTRDSSGTATLYVSQRQPDGSYIPIPNTPDGGFGGSFNNWTSGFRLSVGNEPSYGEARDTTGGNSIDPEDGETVLEPGRTSETRVFRGSYYLLAVYCRALSQQDILAARAPNDWITKPVTLDLNTPISPNRTKAQKIYERLTGLRVPIDAQVIKDMEADLNLNTAAGNLAAAEKATDKNSVWSSGFYNRTLKDFAKRLSNRDETVSVPLNDFSAMVIGHVLDDDDDDDNDGDNDADDDAADTDTDDDRDMRELLTGDFYYEGDPAKTAVPREEIGDFLTSNNHYMALENQNYDLKDVLKRVNGQKLYNGQPGVAGQVTPNPDPAGLLTSRNFMAEHAIAGTNRRLIEYSFREFMCRPIKEWADNQASDANVGRDVDRTPTGDHAKYTTTCRGCHSQLDSFRGAFASVTFENGFVKHAFTPGLNKVSIDPANDDIDDEDANPMDMEDIVLAPLPVVIKMNHHKDIFTGGRVISNSTWWNYAIGALNAEYFGWSPNVPDTGAGIRSFGNLLAESEAFPYCMARHAFRAVCKKDASPAEDAMLRGVAAKLRDPAGDNFRLKRAFERIVLTPECLGE